MANSETVLVADITTGKTAEVPKGWLSLFPTLVEVAPVELFGATESVIIENVEEIEIAPIPKTPSVKGKK